MDPLADGLHRRTPSFVITFLTVLSSFTPMILLISKGVWALSQPLENTGKEDWQKLADVGFKKNSFIYLFGCTIPHKKVWSLNYWRAREVLMQTLYSFSGRSSIRCMMRCFRTVLKFRKISPSLLDLRFAPSH